MVTSGTMTNRVDRLATKGLVERMPDPDDKRGVLVRLTDEGRSRVDAALDGLLVQERQLLEALTTSQRESLAAMLRMVVAPFDDEVG
jgi:DNA-binding MarR family transcriptional regulator